MRSPFSAGFLQRHHFAFAVNGSVVSRSTAVARMGTGRGDRRDPSSNPKVARLRELMASDAASGWEKSWEEGLTPWDLAQPTPVVQHLVQRESLPTGRVLVPGCGSGYDVVAIASPERYVVGLEISHSAVKKAKEISDQDEGPPYNVTVADYENVLNPVGFKALSIVDNELAVGPRKGREKLGRWKRCIKQSCL